MKTLLIIFLILTTQSLTAQVFKGKKMQLVIKNHTLYITLQDSLSLSEVQDVFTHSDHLVDVKMKHFDRYVYTKNGEYYRPGMGVFRKPHIYKKEVGVYRKVKKASFLKGGFYHS